MGKKRTERTLVTKRLQTTKTLVLPRFLPKIRSDFCKTCTLHILFAVVGTGSEWIFRNWLLIHLGARAKFVAAPRTIIFIVQCPTWNGPEGNLVAKKPPCTNIQSLLGLANLWGGYQHTAR